MTECWINQIFQWGWIWVWKGRGFLWCRRGNFVSWSENKSRWKVFSEVPPSLSWIKPWCCFFTIFSGSGWKQRLWTFLHRVGSLEQTMAWTTALRLWQRFIWTQSTVSGSPAPKWGSEMWVDGTEPSLTDPSWRGSDGGRDVVWEMWPPTLKMPSNPIWAQSWSERHFSGGCGEKERSRGHSRKHRGRHWFCVGFYILQSLSISSPQTQRCPKKGGRGSTQSEDENIFAQKTSKRLRKPTLHLSESRRWWTAGVLEAGHRSFACGATNRVRDRNVQTDSAQQEAESEVLKSSLCLSQTVVCLLWCCWATRLIQAEKVSFHAAFIFPFICSDLLS